MVNNLFFLDRRNHHNHALAFKFRHTFGASGFFQFNCKTKEEFLSLICKLDRPSSEKDRSLYFRTFLKEAAGMLQFKLEVMFVGIRAEAYLLDDYLGRIGLHLFGLLLLLIEIFLIIKDFAYRGIGFVADLHQIKLHILSHAKSCIDGIDTRVLYIISDESYLCGRDFFVDIEFIFSFFSGAACSGTGEARPLTIRSGTGGPEGSIVGFERCCDKLSSYIYN